jgi:hypothetical protein
VTSWFRRGREAPPAPQPPEDQDAPDKLLLRLWEQVQFINRNAGKLPVEAVVIARQVTDAIREAIETSADRALDVYAVVQINGIVGDYLPTTLRTYLNLDPEITDQPSASGRTPRAGAHDVDLLFNQGNFLRTKFTRSDLDF